VFDSSLRHQVSKGNPAIGSIAGFSLPYVVALTRPIKKPRPVKVGAGVPSAHTRRGMSQTPVCACLAASEAAAGAAGAASEAAGAAGAEAASCSSGSGLDGRSGRCRRSGSRCGRGSRCLLLATGSQGGSSDQGSDDEGLVHFRFSLRRVKKRRSGISTDFSQKMLDSTLIQAKALSKNQLAIVLRIRQ
jgi:hypothetical protein